VIVDKDTPPPLKACMSATYWERTGDPFHADAFPPDVDLSRAIVIGGEISRGPRREGWMAIDWCENPVGFVADGTEIAGEPEQYEFREGPHKHLCAYPPQRT
jgi:hypothetical protein